MLAIVMEALKRTERKDREELDFSWVQVLLVKVICSVPLLPTLHITSVVNEKMVRAESLVLTAGCSPVRGDGDTPTV